MERCTCHPQGADGVTLLDFNEDDLYAASQESSGGIATVRFLNHPHTFSTRSIEAEISRRFRKRLQS